MDNKAMERKLRSGECLAVDKIGWKVDDLPLNGINYTRLHGVVYELPMSYIVRLETGNYDLCIVETESWIWSVGVRESDGRVFASTSAEFYEQPGYKCIWLR